MIAVQCVKHATMKILTDEQREAKRLRDRQRYKAKMKNPLWKAKYQERKRLYQLKHKDKINAKKREAYANNPTIKEYCLKNSKKQNKTKTAKKWRKNYKALPHVKLKLNLARRIIYWLKKANTSKTIHTLDLVGCTVNELKSHIEKQFEPWMTWENHGPLTWHIDHITPCVNFDLTLESEQKKCFHYSNLRPMAAKDNVSKGSKPVNL